MAKSKKSDTQKPIEKMNTAEMLVRAMNVFSDRNVSVGKRRKMIKAIEEILAEPDEPESDEPDGA
jgi:hypothetical protein